jgi:LAGLIDADG endonuclease
MIIFAVYSINSKIELVQLIKIFDQYPLNTSKHLNFLAFKEAFYLYQEFRGINLNSNSIEPLLSQHSSRIEDKKLLFQKILELKNSMN